MADSPYNTASKLPEVAFGEALLQLTTPENRRAAVKTNETLLDSTIEKLLAAFEDAAHTGQNGGEFWDARDLARLLGYSDYRNFLNIVEKAKDACKTTGFSVQDHFVDATDMVGIGSGATRDVETIKLSRYACYLIAQNGDPRKPSIAFAQTYFGIYIDDSPIKMAIFRLFFGK